MTFKFVSVHEVAIVLWDGDLSDCLPDQSQAGVAQLLGPSGIIRFRIATQFRRIPRRPEMHDIAGSKVNPHAISLVDMRDVARYRDDCAQLALILQNAGQQFRAAVGWNLL